MTAFLLRTALILFVILAQFFFIAGFYSGYFAPNFVLMFAVAWTIIIGFEKVWPWIIILGLITDLILLWEIGKIVIILILASYLVSFFSRRLLIEKISGLFVVASFIFIIGNFGNIFFGEWNTIWVYLKGYITSVSATSFFSEVIAQFIFNVILFYVAYWIINKIEGKIEFDNQRIKL